MERPLLARIVVVFADGRRQVTPLAGDGAPDMAVIDALARRRLAAQRIGARMCLRDVSPALAELLELAGLGREMSGEPEGWEEPLGVEEGMDAGDETP
jgi:hypothetical protein